MPNGSLSNDDLAPTEPAQRTWTRWHIAALWVGMAVCIPTYMMGAQLIATHGMSFGSAIAAVAIGNIIILLPLILNGHPGARYGIPFPVLLRSSFGVLGSNIPAMMRALVACGWFGFNTWIGGLAIYLLAVKIAPATSLPQFLPSWVGINTGQLLSYIAFWGLQVVIIVRGMQAIKVLETWAAPLLLVMGLLLFLWAHNKAGSLSAMVASPTHAKSFGLATIGPGITAAVAFWGTLALNIPDFTRFTTSHKDQAVGQAIALPITMTLFAFIGAAVTNTVGLSDPIQVAASIGGIGVTLLALVGLVVATVSTNLAANIVSPANDLSNLSPGRINFRRGAVIAATIGFVTFPWKLFNHMISWLGAYGSLLGAVGGIMIVDYFLIRKTRLNVADLYQRAGEYEFRRGFNPIALAALFIAILPLLPGFLGVVNVMSAPAVFTKLYEWSWFVSFALAGSLHFLGTKLFARNSLTASER